MRSEKVFRAQEKVLNRYALCHLTAKGTRKLHIAATRTEETINEVLREISVGDAMPVTIA